MRKHKCSLIMAVLALFLFASLPVYAAGLKRVETSSSWSSKKRTVAGATFYCPDSSYSIDTGCFSLTVTQNGRTKTVATNCSGGPVISDGKTVYYCGASGNGVLKLYKVDLKSMTRSSVISFGSSAYNVDLCGYYKNKIYFIKNVPDGTFRYVNLSTKKTKTLKKIVSSAECYGNNENILEKSYSQSALISWNCSIERFNSWRFTHSKVIFE